MSHTIVLRYVGVDIDMSKTLRFDNILTIKNLRVDIDVNADNFWTIARDIDAQADNFGTIGLDPRVSSSQGATIAQSPGVLCR